MIQTVKCIKTVSKILLIAPFNKNFTAIATKNKNIKIISKKSCETIQNIYSELFGEHTSAINFHPTLDLVAIANDNHLYIINTTNHDIVQSIKTEEGKITILSFLEKSPYLITGTKNGRIMQYRYDGKIHISRLSSFQSNRDNRVTAITHNQEYLAASNNHGDISIIKFNSHTRKFRLKASTSTISAMAFLEENRLLFGSVDGTLSILQIEQNRVIKQIKSLHKDIRHIVPFKDLPYALIVSRSNSLILLHTKQYKIITSNFLHFETEITHLLLSENNQLLITFKDNSVYKVFLPTQADLLITLHQKQLFKVFQLLESNPMLLETQEAKKAASLYENLYSRALLEYIATNNIKALEPIKPYEQITLKEYDYKSLLLAYKNFPRLQQFYKDKKYALAYALCEKFPSLKFTPQYKKMEEEYRKCFTQAQKQMLLKQEERAKEILAPFATLPNKRIVIQLLLRQNRTFLSFLKAISKKDYASIEMLIETNPNFKEIPSYLNLQEEARQSIEHIKESINNAKIKEAEEEIQKIQYIPLIKEEIHQLYRLTQDAKKLLHYYEKNNFIQCYETLDANSELESMELAKLLEKHWKKSMDLCEIAALEGNIEAIKEHLGELLYIHSRKNKIGDLFRLALQSKIRTRTGRKQYKKAETIIYFYIDLFGLDSEIKKLMQAFENNAKNTLAITLKQQRNKKRDSWSYTDLLKLKVS